MCKSKFYVDNTHEKKYRLSDYFRSYWRQYTKSPKVFIKREQYRAANAIMACRTAILGIEIYACKECGEVSEIYHSCNHRFCPTCGWKDTLEWADRIQYQMLNIKHRHVVFTIPHGLNKLIKDNDRLMYNLLLRSSAETFKDWFAHKHNLDIGIIEVLHTYGEKKEFHPHVHMIVSWGGIHKKNGNLIEIKKEYVNYNFLQKKFRAKFEDGLILMNDKNKLNHKFKDRKSFMNYVKQLNQTDWVLHLEPAMKTPAKVIRYIGRYSKRACLSEYKITNIDGEFITFRYKDYKDRDENKIPKEKELRLHYYDFFPRLMQHVPSPYFRLVRYYGLYSNHGRIPCEYKCSRDENSVDQTSDESFDPKICETCNLEKILVVIYFEKRPFGKRGFNEFNEILKRHKRKRWKKSA